MIGLQTSILGSQVIASVRCPKSERLFFVPIFATLQTMGSEKSIRRGSVWDDVMEIDATVKKTRFALAGMSERESEFAFRKHLLLTPTSSKARSSPRLTKRQSPRACITLASGIGQI